MGFRNCLLVMALCCSSVCIAEDTFVIQDIRVEGIQRTEAGTVFSYLPVKVGDVLDKAKVSAAIKALYATGFFRDVKLKAEGSLLIVQVEERPAIAQITINGAKEFDKDKLKDGLKQAGLSESRIFNRSLLEKAEQELKRQYISRGKYAVKITTTTTPLERNRIGINFDIKEGRTARIKQINIIGNHTFSEKKILKLFSLQTPNLLTWFNKQDQYSKQKLSADIEALRSYYLDRGYLEFNIDSTQVSITPDMKDIYITINVTEGPQYTVSDIKLAGELIVPEEELRKLIKLEVGGVFVREKLTESIKLISDRLGDDGYAFANVNAAPELDKETHQTVFTFFIDPGRRVYVRRINVSGNERTRDEVIRREFRQMEGGWHSTSQINTSRRRIDRLDFFTSVNVETPPVADVPDQLDINVSVVEKPTGAIMFGAGYSDREGIILNGSIAQNNIFGTGNFLSLQVNTGSVNKILSASFTNPYYTINGVSLGLEAFRRAINTRSLNSVGVFNTDTTGASIRFGIPVAENDSISLGLGFEQTKIKLRDDSPQRFVDFVERFGKNSTSFPLTLSWARDRRDSAIWTTSGLTQRVFGEFSAPIADLRYYKVSLEQRWFYPLTKHFTLMLNGEVGVGDGYSGKPLPFFKNFFAGGFNSVRGFNINTLGPRDNDNRVLGGSKRIVGNIEVLFPVPFMLEDKKVRLSAFLDGGTIVNSFSGLGSNDFRYAAGLAVTWISPMGPLKFSVAQPFNDQPGDKVQRFQFQLGQTF
ncbi:outer membrane protein assembly factor BamA [Nitrosomonas mobilis]|uniref:Outer membrane protein assembly factor BamA n=1 Tax=Nitrosomonas mobilis TaxID=51642 RepID=A0A1G5SGF0_9PROT|nr:Outer membrane protein assembly factor BamA [Nitrosomonas mobilis]